MSTTFTVGSSTFSALDTTNGRKALAILVDAADLDLKRFHVPGVDGNFVVRGGIKGRRILARVRYIGSNVGAALALYVADRTSWEATSVSITDDGGTSYTTCNVASMRVTSPPRPTGRASGQAYLDVEAIFTVDKE
ncbi:MAG: hypothetical protein ACE5FI_14080 [Anaerolineales bacterium]